MTVNYLVGNDQACRVSVTSKEEMLKLAIEKFKQPQEEFYYGITHYYLEEKVVNYFKVNLAPETVHALVAFVEFVASDYDMNWSLSDEVVLKVINKYFGKVTHLEEEPRDYTYIDQYFNWEFFCGSGVEMTEEFLLEGISNYIHELTKQEIEQWNNEECGK